MPPPELWAQKKIFFINAADSGQVIRTACACALPGRQRNRLAAHAPGGALPPSPEFPVAVPDRLDSSLLSHQGDDLALPPLDQGDIRIEAHLQTQARHD